MKESAQDRILLLLMYVVITAFAIACLIPFVTVISGSLSTEVGLLKYGYRIFPKRILV